MHGPISPGERHFGAHAAAVDAALDQLRRDDVAARIRRKDHTVWSLDPREISNRLGWLDSPSAMVAELPRLTAFRDELLENGVDTVVLLGMGGSSLAPEGFGAMLRAPGHPALVIIDSTDPDLIAGRTGGLDLTRTLFIVATKSGGTVETLSAFKYFFRRLVDHGALHPGRQFVAITDPGSALEALAREHGFREIFLNDPDIGGRYSALSFFGLVPAVLVGVDAGRLLERARAAAEDDELATTLAALMGGMARRGRDKLTISSSPELASFADWAEQLVAESTGKNGVGVLPVVHEPLASPDSYGSDRVFVDLRLAGDSARDAALAALAAAGHPVLVLDLADRYDIGGQFFVWELATAMAGALLGVQPFDQPNVEAAKNLARDMVAAYLETGALPGSESSPVEQDHLEAFLARAEPGDYVAIHAYLDPVPEVEAALSGLREAIRGRHRLATTLGYGPRFLHSTGQLHKGDGGNGLFIQLISEPAADLPIPDEPDATGSTMSFQTLKRAQALGDGQALEAAGRRLIRFELGREAAAAIRLLAGGR